MTPLAGTLEYKLVHGGRIDGVRVQLSPKLWTLEGKLPLSLDVNGFRETGGPVSGPARISFCLVQSQQGLAYLLAELDVGVKLCGQDGELTNRLDMVSPRSPDDADNLSPCAPIEYKPEGLCSDRMVALETGTPCFQRRT